MTRTQKPKVYKSKTSSKKPFEGLKYVKPNKKERYYESDLFQCEVSGDLIFIWGGNQEGCVSIRVMKEFVKWLKSNKVI